MIMLSSKKCIRCSVAVLTLSVVVIILLELWRLQDDPVVRTKVGFISGLKASDGDYSMFMGIPFAKVNESNPFGHSTPYPPFKGIFVANNDSAKCPQILEYNNTFDGTLDCLHLNIYVPNSASVTNRLPVLVYIFGSNYEVGFAGRFYYGPKFLMKQNIILITMNYRVGPYGFMCLDTPEVPGNQGVKDQVLALRWVKENIDAFGGDTNKITIAGESSGGQNVDFHITYGDGDLFNNAIIGAGTCLDTVAMIPSDISPPLKLAQDLGFKTDDVNKALTFLSKQDLKSVIISSKKLDIKYGPCVEKKFKGVESFINEFPKLSETSKAKNISLIMGISSREMLMNYDDNVYFDDKKLQMFFEEHLKKYFGFDEDKLEDMAEYVRNFYIGDVTDNELISAKVIDFDSDLAHNYAIKKRAEHYAVIGAKVYFSMFSYAGRRNLIKLLRNVDIYKEGASHVDEIGYLFDVSYLNKPITLNDQLIIDRMATLWANFVKFGDPTPETTDLLPIKWDPVTYEHFSYLNVDLQLSLNADPFYERMKFWDRFFDVNVTSDWRNKK